MASQIESVGWPVRMILRFCIANEINNGVDLVGFAIDGQHAVIVEDSSFGMKL
jgi:hypothetical protein